MSNPQMQAQPNMTISTDQMRQHLGVTANFLANPELPVKMAEVDSIRIAIQILTAVASGQAVITNPPAPDDGGQGKVLKKVAEIENSEGQVPSEPEVPEAVPAEPETVDAEVIGN